MTDGQVVSKLQGLNSRVLGWFLLRLGRGGRSAPSLAPSWGLGAVFSLRLHGCLFAQASLFMGTSFPQELGPTLDLIFLCEDPAFSKITF